MKILKLILKSRKLNFCKVFSLFLPLLSGVPHLYGLSLLSDLRSFHWSSHFPLVLSLLPGLTSSIRSYLFSHVLPLLPGLTPSLCSYPFSLVLISSLILSLFFGRIPLLSILTSDWLVTWRVRVRTSLDTVTV